MAKYQCVECGAVVPNPQSSYSISHLDPKTQKPCKSTRFKEAVVGPDKRFVFYAPDWGVYLGDGHWSAINPGPKDSAPTYEEPVRVVMRPIPPQGMSIRDGNGLTRVSVDPDMPDHRASSSACEKIGLPGWNPTSEKL